MHVIEKAFAAGIAVADAARARMIVGVDETGHHHHALGVEDPRFFARQAFDVVAAHGDEAAGAHGKGLGLRQCIVNGMDARVMDDQVRFLGIGKCRIRAAPATAPPIKDMKCLRLLIPAPP